MNIGIDMDGVLYDWEGEARFLLDWEFGIKLPKSTHWDFIEKSIDREKWDWLWSKGIYMGLFLQGNPERGAIEGVKHLYFDKGHSVYITTNRKVHDNGLNGRVTERDTHEWLNFHSVPYDDIIFTPEKENLAHIDIFIEDKVENAVKMLKAGKRVILFDQPWNQGELDLVVWTEYRRARDWKQIINNWDLYEAGI